MVIRQKQITNKGMGLIEVLIAVTVSVIALTAMVSMVVTALRSSLQSRMYLEATKLANQQIERVRALRDSTTWSDTLTLLDGCTGSTKCSLASNLAKTTSPGTFEGLSYSFQAIDAITGSAIAAGTTTSVRITAEASWDNGAKKTTMITDLSNWQGK